MDFEQFKEAYNLSLDAQQEAAVQAVDGPVLLVAVPGSGKTTVLVTRLGYLCHVRGIPPERILTMTYTVAAARDMRIRFADLFGEETAARLAFHTINGVCSRIIRLYERELGRMAFSLLEDGGEKSALISGLYRSLCGDFATESMLKGIQTAITYAKNQMLREEELAKLEVEGVSDFPALFRAYEGALRERKQMDYDDQMVYALQILRRYPQILQSLRRRFPYLCVDEAQDTSKIQHAIIRLLAGENGNLFLVGDEDQSIYGFRAACPEALTGFDAVYPQARILRMEQNYRSTQAIVAAADGFIQKNRSRMPKHMRAVRGGGREIREQSVYDRQGQYAALCRMAEGCTRETAVLYRDNDSAIPLIDLMNRKGIPYRCRQVDSLFFSNRVVRDITDIIRLAMHQDDGERFLTLYYKLGAGISRAVAMEAAARAGQTGESVFTCAAAADGASPWTKKQCRALQTHMCHLLTERADRAVYRIVHFMGYGDYCRERGGDLTRADLLEALGAQEPTPVRLLERLEELRQVVQAGSSDPDSPLVLSTIHSSKGLEYDRVILMDVMDGLLPRSVPRPGASQEEGEAYEEERRLFYVGMTRAREELQIFTFRKLELESTFAREIFPTRPERQATVFPKRISRSEPAGKAPVSTESYCPGLRLCHKTFGPGTLTSRSGDIAVVAFDSGEVKKIALSTALRAGQLRLA